MLTTNLLGCYDHSIIETRKVVVYSKAERKHYEITQSEYAYYNDAKLSSLRV